MRCKSGFGQNSTMQLRTSFQRKSFGSTSAVHQDFVFWQPMKSAVFECFLSLLVWNVVLMQWKSGCGHLVSHELQRGGGSTSIVGRAGKKGIVHSEHVSRCAAETYRPCTSKYIRTPLRGCVSRCTLVSPRLASIWRIVMFLACDVTADGLGSWRQKRTMYIYGWRSSVRITEYNLGLVEYSKSECRVRGDKRGQYSGVDVRMGGGDLDGNWRMAPHWAAACEHCLPKKTWYLQERRRLQKSKS